MKKNWLLLMLPHDDFLMPYGIMYISSALKAHGVTVYTQNLTYLKKDIITFLQEMIYEKHIDVVAYGGFSWQCSIMRNLANTIKSVRRDVLVAIGGGIVTTNPVISMRAIENADIGMIGEGEECVCEIADALENNGDLSVIPGLVIKSGEEYIMTGYRKYVEDIDKKPLPDREGFGYSIFVRRTFNRPYFGIFASRSCAFNCTFCFHHEPYRQRSLDSIFEELDLIVEEYDHPSFIHFYDELFSVNPERLEEFCNRIKQYNISYELYMRVTDITPELVLKLKASGCKAIGIGLESYSEKILASMNKHIHQCDIDNALKILDECQVGFMGNFILGDTEDTEETIKESLDYRKKHPEYNINIYMIRTLPGSTIYAKAVADGRIKDEVEFLRADCPYINVSKLSDDEWKRTFDMYLEERLYSPDYLTEFDLTPVSVNAHNGHGEGIYVMICPKCQGKTLFRTSLMRYSSKAACKHCNSRWDIDPIRYFKTEPFSFDEKACYAIWGCNSITYHLMKRYKRLADDDVVVVDMDKELQGHCIWGKDIQGALHTSEVDSLIITALASRERIIREVREKYPHIKNIFYPSIMQKGEQWYLYLHKCTKAEIEFYAEEGTIGKIG